MGKLGTLDFVIFVGFVIVVIAVGLWASRKKKTSEDYFLAGRSLPWWLIGISMIAGNISAEQFIGQASEGYMLGLAIASYEWIAAITLVVVGIWFLPKFLKAGVYTIPEFLEHRFSKGSRSIMSLYMLLATALVVMPAVLLGGARALHVLFEMPLWIGIWVIALIGGFYTMLGGLGAVVWTDLIFGATLIIGGLIVTIVGFGEVGFVSFFEENADKLNMIMPADNKTLPWTALLAGIWIPNFFYWGLNQYIVQRTLGARSLKEGQRGTIFAAALKLIIPVITVFPGIMAYQLYANQIQTGDDAYPTIVAKLIPAGLTGLILAALTGAIMSSLNCMLNSCSTIFTSDLYKPYAKPDSDEHHLVTVGRISTVGFMLLACLWAQLVKTWGIRGIFNYIQQYWGFFSPGILGVCLFGLFTKKTPPFAAWVGLLLNPVVYAILLFGTDIAFLNVMIITLVVVCAWMAFARFTWPVKMPKEMPVRKEMDMTTAPDAKWLGAIIVIIVVLLYVIFSPLVLAS